MNPAIGARIPLVCRPKPPGVPLTERISELTALTVEPAGADHHQRVARASGVLNFAALIASDAGLPELAADLCWKQHRIFTDASCRDPGALDQDTGVMALMPVVNIARLLIREGDGDGAYQLLQRIYGAAQQRGTATIGPHTIDLALLTRTNADHRKICTELWVTLLVDGARALARCGRWTQAAHAMATHRGIGNRLLDGRQIKIMSLMEQGLHQQATTMIDSSVPTEPWENTVAAVLRLYCRPPTSTPSQRELHHAVQETLALVEQPEPMTAAFRARIGLTALDLIAEPTPRTSALQTAILDVAFTDAYAARDVLADPTMRSQLSPRHQHTLETMLTTAGLGTGKLPPAHLTALTAAVHTAENQLRALLAAPPATDSTRAS